MKMDQDLIPIPSCLGSAWQTTASYHAERLDISSSKFMQVTDLLLENPNLNSTHLFRADILYDSAHVLKTTLEKEVQLQWREDGPATERVVVDTESPPMSIPRFDGFEHRRWVLRKLIPRKPQLDHPLEQVCHIYEILNSSRWKAGHLVVYTPVVESESDVPWYHPPVKALAYLYQQEETGASLSVHFLPFYTSPDLVASRLHRTLISLLRTLIRLAKHPAPEPSASKRETTDSVWPSALTTAPSALKDTILPQHIVQDTYSRLKQTYASDLMGRWVEKTEPSKHVFEDLSIAAFLIEIWSRMYTKDDFPGFVDIACGNGVLVYILIQEGYHGSGFDARRRKTWDVLGIDECLEEKICIPQPFMDALQASGEQVLPGTTVHSGIFKPGTFIISNHADELTPWTPILAAVSCPGSPLPFLAIPCCSHAMSGAKHRYSAKDFQSAPTSVNDGEQQSATGDLKALRAAKARAATHADEKSMYACLTRKVVAIAEEVGFDVEMTLMRIPSTRNIGIVGNRKKVSMRPRTLDSKFQTLSVAGTEKHVIAVDQLLERECTISGGVLAAAKTWVERAQKIQTGRGRGKVNLGGGGGKRMQT